MAYDILKHLNIFVNAIFYLQILIKIVELLEGTS